MKNDELKEIVKKQGMSEKEIDQMFETLIEKNGHWSQIEMLTEEIGEFLQAINKLKRTKKCNDKIHYPSVHSDIKYSQKYFDVCSEIADIEILILQMKKIFSYEAIELSKQRKLLRQKGRIEKNSI